MKVEVIRVSGEREIHQIPHGDGSYLNDIRKLIGAHTLDTVTLKDRVHVMFVDDDAYETRLVDHGLQPDARRPGQMVQTWEQKCIKAKKPVNAEATKLYWEKCGHKVAHQIVGDVAIVHDNDWS